MLMDEKAAAAYLGVSVALMRKWRQLGQGGPVWCHMGRLVRYAPVDLDAYIAECRVLT